MQSDMVLKAGELVIVFGLLKATQYNGKYAIVEAEEKDGRIAVTMLHPYGKIVGCRSVNLKVAERINRSEVHSETQFKQKIGVRFPLMMTTGVTWIPPDPKRNTIRAPGPPPNNANNANNANNSNNSKSTNNAMSLPESQSRDRKGSVSGLIQLPNPIENLLLLLPGLGGDVSAFVKLAKTMNIPQTACIALSPLLPLPLGMGSAWLESFEANGEVIVPKKGERRRVASKLKSVRYVHRVLAVLRGSLGIPLNRFFVLGFSQGAHIATDLVRCPPSGLGRLGGIVCQSSTLLEEEVLEGGFEDAKFLPKTDYQGEAAPMLITHGTRDQRVTIGSARASVSVLKRLLKRAKIRNSDTNIQFKEYYKGHTGVSSRSEAKDLLQFFSEHVRLRNLAMERDPDFIDITNQNDPNIVQRLKELGLAPNPNKHKTEQKPSD